MFSGIGNVSACYPGASSHFENTEKHDFAMIVVRGASGAVCIRRRDSSFLKPIEIDRGPNRNPAKCQSYLVIAITRAAHYYRIVYFIHMVPAPQRYAVKKGV